MAQSREVMYLDDFSGGLNLTTQQQGLSRNESPDCLNVDFGLRGGFITRGGFRSLEYDANIEDAYFLGATYYSDDVVLILSGSTLFTWNGTTFATTSQTLTDETDERIVSANFDRKTYFANGRSSGAIVMYSWDGSTKATLGSSWSNDYTTPTGGNVPDAKLIAAHQGFMWVADTVEGSASFPHRVRFSHLQNPEDWAEADYFDVDPTDDGNPITALIPFREVLLVFKQNSTYAVYGYDRDSFVLERISDNSGISNSEAFAQSAGVGYWFGSDGQLMGYNGNDVVPVPAGEGLRWWADLGKIAHTGSHRLMWADGRLYMSLEAGSGETVNRWLFVYDPRVGRRGALTRYDPVVAEMMNWQRLDQDADPLFIFSADSNLYKFDQSANQDTVDAGSGPVATRINAYYRTAWFTGGETATKKRWKRPRVTAAADNDTTLTIDIYHDFVSSDHNRQSEFLIDSSSTSVWDTMVWDDDEWAAPDTDAYTFRRQPSAGSSYAVSFKFSSLDNGGRWWVDSIALPFRRRQVR